ncbi:hypothetical protein BAA08_01695 [Bizionia sp. APA-3]|nr:hypothetical protein BAA08_01695 [Bizionia sp. APA-3]
MRIRQIGKIGIGDTSCFKGFWACLVNDKDRGFLVTFCYLFSCVYRYLFYSKYFIFIGTHDVLLGSLRDVGVFLDIICAGAVNDRFS